MKEMMAVSFSFLLLIGAAKASFSAPAPVDNTAALNQKIQAQLQTMNEKIQTQIKTVQTQLQTQIETVNTQVQAKMKTMQTTLEAEIQKVQAEVVKAK